MQYINKKTGAKINSPCIIYGGNWVEVEPKEEDTETKKSVEGLEEMKLAQLKELAKELDLATSGTKTELIERISGVSPEDEDEPEDEGEDQEDEDE